MRFIRQESAPPSPAPAPVRSSRFAAAVLSVCLLIALPAAVRAQVFPSSPVTTAGGRLTIGGEGSIALSPNDEKYFNYSDYDYDLLRQIRADASAVFHIGSQVSLLGDVRVQGPVGEGDWAVRPYALFARIRPWTGRNLDVQAGLIPPVFGSFSRRSYGADNPLIGFPLAYQYLTALRPDALPATADDLLAMRGRGWLTSYPVGSVDAEHGVPLVDGLHYQTGVEIRAGSDPIQVSAAVTNGTPSVPRAPRWTGPQVSGRITWRHGPGLLLGASASRGVFVSRALSDSLGAPGRTSSNDQRALGVDAEFSRGYWLVRSEAVFSSWRVPMLSAPFINTPLRAFGVDLEARYRLTPGLYIAGRVDRLDFNRITGSSGVATEWDAPVRRVEVAGGYSLQRNVLLKVGYQYNWRDSADERVSRLLSAQMMFWF